MPHYFSHLAHAVLLLLTVFALQPSEVTLRVGSSNAGLLCSSLQVQCRGSRGSDLMY